VQVEQVEPLDAQPAEAHLGLLPQVLRAAERHPAVAMRPRLARLGGDHHAGRVRVQRLRDQLLVVAEPVRIGGVDVRDAEVDGPPQDVAGRRAVGGGLPGARTGQPQCAEADAHLRNLHAAQPLPQAARGPTF
jgi:hypothetical protein